MPELPDVQVFKQYLDATSLHQQIEAVEVRSQQVLEDDKAEHLEDQLRGRLNVAAEHEAVHLYMAHAEATDHPLAKKVLIDIANEERVHIGEFERLLEILTGDEDQRVAEGRKEVDEMAAERTGTYQDDGDRWRS
jgi:rubrerythrin